MNPKAWGAVRNDLSRLTVSVSSFYEISGLVWGFCNINVRITNENREQSDRLSTKEYRCLKLSICDACRSETTTFGPSLSWDDLIGTVYFKFLISNYGKRNRWAGLEKTHRFSFASEALIILTAFSGQLHTWSFEYLSFCAWSVVLPEIAFV